MKVDTDEILLSETREKKRSIENDKVTADNVYKTLIYFEELYDQMNQEEKRQLLKSLIEEIHIYDERKENGQWLKSIKFRLPIIEGNWNIGFNNDGQGEMVVLLSQQKPDYVLNEHGLKVSNLYISQVKRKCGIEVGDNYNLLSEAV